MHADVKLVSVGGWQVCCLCAQRCQLACVDGIAHQQDHIYWVSKQHKYVAQQLQDNGSGLCLAVSTAVLPLWHCDAITSKAVCAGSTPHLQHGTLHHKSNARSSRWSHLTDKKAESMQDTHNWLRETTRCTLHDRQAQASSEPQDTYGCLQLHASRLQAWKHE